jgi:putative ABC transport system substrate-binding protein
MMTRRAHTFPHTLARTCGLIAGLAITLIPGVEAAPSKILVVKSNALPMYDVAVKGIKRCVGGTLIQELLLPENADEAEANLLNATPKPGDVLIIGVGSRAATLARKKIPAAPSVFCMTMNAADPELKSGGVVLDLPPAAYVDYIRTNFPDIKRIGILFTPGSTQALATSFKTLNNGDTTIVLEPVAGITQLDSAIKNLKTKADSLLMIGDPAIYNQTTAPHLILLSLQISLPIFAISPSFAQAGALAAVYPDIEDNGCQTGEMAVRVIKGESHTALPVLSPRKTASTVNMIVSQRMGVAIPKKAMEAAEKIIQ